MAIAVCALSLPIQAQQVVGINFDTSLAVPLSPTYSGFNTNDVSNTWQFEDPLYQSNTAVLQPKILRFPGGGAAGRYDWRTGDIPQKFMDRSFALGLSDPLNEDVDEDQAKVRTKGGVNLQSFYDSVVLTSNSNLLITLNSLTDIPAFPASGEPALSPSAYAVSAKDLAQYVKDHNINVKYWDLMNEPYLQGKLEFWTQISKVLKITRSSNEPLGHYYGRTYMRWMQLFSNAIKSVLPDAKTVIKPANGKAVTVIWNGETDSQYQLNFNQAIWDYSKQHGVFYDAMSIHWYPCLPLVGETIEKSRDCLAGSSQFIDALINNYFVSNNQTFLGRGDLPILMTETNLAKENDLSGTIYNGIFLAENALRNARSPQFVAYLPHVLAGAGGSDRGAFKLYEQKSWMDLALDAYASTSSLLNSSLLPYHSAGLVSFTSYADNVDASGQVIENATIDYKLIPTIPNAPITDPFKDYNTYFSAHGLALQVINEIFATGVQNYPALVTSGAYATVPVGLQPVTPIDTGLGTTTLTTDAVFALGILDQSGKRHALVINKSSVSHKIRIKWAGISPATSTWSQSSVSSSDYAAQNTDASPTNIAIVRKTFTPLKDSVTIEPYSVNAISFDP